ncbi:MAG: hypothetical protein M1830_006038, partial [Pleopsidium flavum]
VSRGRRSFEGWGVPIRSPATPEYNVGLRDASTTRQLQPIKRASATKANPESGPFPLALASDVSGRGVRHDIFAHFVTVQVSQLSQLSSPCIRNIFGRQFAAYFKCETYGKSEDFRK